MGRPTRKQPEVAVETYKPARMLKDFRRVRTEIKPRQSSMVSNPRKIEMIERRYRVIELRKMGYTLREIAWELNASEDTVIRDLREILRVAIKDTCESTEECRQLEIERLDALLKAYYATATEPLVDEYGTIIPENMAAAAFVLKINYNPQQKFSLH